MRYRFLDQSDERLIELSELPLDDIIAVAVRTTGYDAEEDEIVELSIAGATGETLFSQKVKPQNKESWKAGEASGGITPEDVADALELYQFEEEISDLFENAELVVAPHIDFAQSMIEGSWVTLPKYEGFDLTDEFCKAHSTADCPNEPAPVASLQDIAEYYGIDEAMDACDAEARIIDQCYKAFVQEQMQQREAKGEAHWEAYRRRKEEERKADKAYQAAERVKEIKRTRLNAILWLGAAVIFGNLAVQMGIRGMDGGLVAIVAVIAVFLTIKWITTTYKITKL